MQPTTVEISFMQFKRNGFFMQVKLFCEDFDEVFSGFKVSAGTPLM